MYLRNAPYEARTSYWNYISQKIPTYTGSMVEQDGRKISYSVSLNKRIERGLRVSGGPHFSCLNICLSVFYQLIDDDFSLFDFTAFQ